MAGICAICTSWAAEYNRTPAEDTNDRALARSHFYCSRVHFCGAVMAKGFSSLLNPRAAMGMASSVSARPRGFA